MATDELLSSAYHFHLPPERIAQSHAHPRDASRLFVMRAGAIEHATFRQLPSYLRPGDLLVLNETKVIAARVFGTRHGSGGRVEVLLLRPAMQQRYDGAAVHWLALVRPGRKLREGQRINFGTHGSAIVQAVDDDGIRELAFELSVPFETFLAEAGTLPLPPYITNESAQAQDDYQTIFARTPGSVAAPTASLHFTEQVMSGLAERGVEIAKLSLEVGIGTFRPMKSGRLDEHHMHAEAFEIPTATLTAINRAKSEGRRIVAAGTTVMRALEGSAAKHGSVQAGQDETAIFIMPGFRFAVVDALITNFHLPESTLLVLVSAFAGRKRMLDAYAEAIAKEYRFFSFGDAMYLEP